VQCQKKKRCGNHYWARVRTEKRTQVYKNLIVIQWSREDVQDNCKSYRAFDHNERFGMGDENVARRAVCLGRFLTTLAFADGRLPTFIALY
jgi:hypothetical protein